jgi:hypothetical protein
MRKCSPELITGSLMFSRYSDGVAKLSCLLFGCALLVACDNAAPSQLISPPTGPTAASPRPVIGGTLSGVVFEIVNAERMPVAGVEVYCDACGPPLGHTLTRTDSNGTYELNGAPAGLTRVLLSKSGFKLPEPAWVGPGGIGWMGGVDVAVNGDTRYDIEIVRQ